MILAIERNDYSHYGYNLILESIHKRFGKTLTVCSMDQLHTVNVNDFLILLYSFSFMAQFFELSYIFRKLKVAPYAEERDQILIVGGPPISENPEPIAELIDIGYSGEGEWQIQDIIEIIVRNDFQKQPALAEIYEQISAAYVPKYYQFEYQNNEIIDYEGRPVTTNRENINRSFELYEFYSREKKGEHRCKEYQLEYHRGCKRRCKFCSYSHIQQPYRAANYDILERRITKIARRDPAPQNKIVGIQTNIFHLPLKLLKLLKLYDKLPNYTSACLADLYSVKGLELWHWLQENSQTYLRVGIEGFSERERKLIGKPIPNRMLYNLPAILTRGTKIKMFFIVGLPGQTIDDVKEFESTMATLGDNLDFYFTIDIFKTALNYKLNTGLNGYKKEYNRAVMEYVETKMRRKYGKLTVKVYKKQSYEYWLQNNILSLGDRRLTPHILEAGQKKHPDRGMFLELVHENIDLEPWFEAYNDNQLLPNCYLEG